MDLRDPTLAGGGDEECHAVGVEPPVAPRLAAPILPPLEGCTPLPVDDRPQEHVGQRSGCADADVALGFTLPDRWGVARSEAPTTTGAALPEEGARVSIRGASEASALVELRVARAACLAAEQATRSTLMLVREAVSAGLDEAIPKLVHALHQKESDLSSRLYRVSERRQDSRHSDARHADRHADARDAESRQCAGHHESTSFHQSTSARASSRPSSFHEAGVDDSPAGSHSEASNAPGGHSTMAPRMSFGFAARHEANIKRIEVNIADSILVDSLGGLGRHRSREASDMTMCDAPSTGSRTVYGMGGMTSRLLRRAQNLTARSSFDASEGDTPVVPSDLGAGARPPPTSLGASSSANTNFLAVPHTVEEKERPSLDDETPSVGRSETANSGTSNGRTRSMTARDVLHARIQQITDEIVIPRDDDSDRSGFGMGTGNSAGDGETRMCI